MRLAQVLIPFFACMLLLACALWFVVPTISAVNALFNPACLDLIHAEPVESARSISDICRNVKGN